MSNTLLFVYPAISSEDLWNLGNDLYFHSKPFSWVIWKRKIFERVKIGARLFFCTSEESAGGFFLTGMIKVDRIVTQVQAANDPGLYCGKEIESCPFKIKPLQGLDCLSKEERARFENEKSITIKERNCRSNIIVNPNGEYKEFCDGGEHLGALRKYSYVRMYVISTVEDSIATKRVIPLSAYLSPATGFGYQGKFYGYKLTAPLANSLEDVLRKSEQIPKRSA